MRIGELANKHGMKTPELLTFLERVGIEKTSPLSKLTAEEIRRIEDVLHPPKRIIVEFPQNSPPRAELEGGPWSGLDIRKALWAIRRAVIRWRANEVKKGA